MGDFATSESISHVKSLKNFRPHSARPHFFILCKLATTPRRGFGNAFFSGEVPSREEEVQGGFFYLIHFSKYIFRNSRILCFCRSYRAQNLRVDLLLFDLSSLKI